MASRFRPKVCVRFQLALVSDGTAGVTIARGCPGMRHCSTRAELGQFLSVRFWEAAVRHTGPHDARPWTKQLPAGRRRTTVRRQRRPSGSRRVGVGRSRPAPLPTGRVALSPEPPRFSFGVSSPRWNRDDSNGWDSSCRNRPMATIGDQRKPFRARLPPAEPCVRFACPTTLHTLPRRPPSRPPNRTIQLSSNTPVANGPRRIADRAHEATLASPPALAKVILARRTRAWAWRCSRQQHPATGFGQRH